MNTSDAAAALHAQLEESLWNLVSSDDWLAALKVASQFHDYSFANAQLIHIEAHRRGITPTRVAGYRKWQELGRQVRKGEKGIPILAPIIRKTRDPEPDATATNNSAHDHDTREEERRVVGFRVVHIFDISQTDGEPLPEVRAEHVTGDLPQQWDTIAALIDAEGFTLELVEASRLGGANGVTTWDSRHVGIRNDLPGAQRFKTAAHELAHIRLHNPNGGERPDCRGVIEVEAESVAYIVAGAAGIDTASYSLPYVATWAKGNPNLIAQTAQRVLTCARGILPALQREPERQIAQVSAPEQQQVAAAVSRSDADQPAPTLRARRGAMYSFYPPGHAGILTQDGGCATCAEDATHLVVHNGPGTGRGSDAYYELACAPHAERAHRGGAMAYPATVIPGGIPRRGTTAHHDTQRIEEVLDRAIAHYQGWLRGPKGQPAREHLEGRKFTDEITERFQLGYAPPGWQTLTGGLQRDGFTPSDLLASGIVARARTGRLYDTMRGRLMFPIHDHQGHPVGFAGRIIERDGPKYLNTRGTQLYQKKEILYAHHHAHLPIVHNGGAVLVEGYLDAIALHQAGITNTVATGGTAMAHYLANLRRTTHNITIAFDNDEGGTAALARIHEDTAQVDPDLNVRVAILPEGNDPADLIAQGEVDVLRKALAEAVPSVIYKIDRTLDRYNLDEPESKWRAIRDVTATVVGVTNPDARQAAVDHLTERLDWDPDVHHEDLDTYITRSAAFDQPRSRQRTAPGRSL